MSTPAPPTNLSGILNSLGHAENEILSLTEQRDCYLASREAYRIERDTLKARAETLDRELTEAAKDISELTRQLSFARQVLEDCRPMVKGRIGWLYDNGGPVDDSILGRIESALASDGKYV